MGSIPEKASSTEAGIREAEFWNALDNGAVQCKLCHHNCRLALGATGICRVRVNKHGKLSLPWFGGITSMAIDPMEKKPLHHFLPGETVFSVGFAGCNLRCPFCQNWRISQETDLEFQWMSPKELVSHAISSHCPAIAFTYSEPTVHVEYLIDAMSLARRSGLKTVLVTNGSLNPVPAERLLALTDAANVDLKTWSDADYRRKLSGDRDSVLAFIRKAHDSCHVEITTLVVPGLSEGDEDIASIASFIAGLSSEIPLHLSAYHPAWKYGQPSTELSRMEELAAIAGARLQYVYIGNVSSSGNDTVCPACGSIIVRRRGYSVDMASMGRSKDGMATCSSCGLRLPIVLDGV